MSNDCCPGGRLPIISVASPSFLLRDTRRCIHPGHGKGSGSSTAGAGRPCMTWCFLFQDGTVTGEGRDIIGRFSFRGEFTPHGTIRMIKQYIDRHDVLYQGVYDGEGSIHGTWSIGDLWTGLFARSPARLAAWIPARIQDLV